MPERIGLQDTSRPIFNGDVVEYFTAQQKCMSVLDKQPVTDQIYHEYVFL